jgi:glycosyltransferase involved in cell wall biosynthesis
MSDLEVLVVTNMYPTAEEPWYGSFVKEQMDAVRRHVRDLHVFAFDGRAQSRRYVEAAREVRRLSRTRHFGLIHAHYGLSGAVAMTQRRLPIVTTFWGSDTGYVRWQRFVSWGVARRTFPIFVAEANARVIGISDPVVISSGVDIERFRPVERMRARRALGWPADVAYVLFPGSRVNARKRFDLFESAVREARKQLPDLAAVSLEGFQREEVPLVMNAADALLMTSDWEGSPLAVKEALACRTPVVAVPVGDVAEVVAGLPGCEVVERQPELIGDALLRALRSGRPAELRARAEHFSQHRVAERIVEVYERVLMGSRT